MNALIKIVLLISIIFQLCGGFIVWAKISMQIEEEGLKSIMVKDMILGFIFLPEMILYTLIMKICQYVYMIYRSMKFLNYKPFDK